LSFKILYFYAYYWLFNPAPGPFDKGKWNRFRYFYNQAETSPASVIAQVGIRKPWMRCGKWGCGSFENEMTRARTLEDKRSRQGIRKPWLITRDVASGVVYLNEMTRAI